MRATLVHPRIVGRATQLNGGHTVLRRSGRRLLFIRTWPRFIGARWSSSRRPWLATMPPRRVSWSAAWWSRSVWCPRAASFGSRCVVSWLPSCAWRRGLRIKGAPAVLPRRSCCKSRWMRGHASAYAERCWGYPLPVQPSRRLALKSGLNKPHCDGTCQQHRSQSSRRVPGDERWSDRSRRRRSAAHGELKPLAGEHRPRPTMTALEAAPPPPRPLHSRGAAPGRSPASPAWAIARRDARSQAGWSSKAPRTAAS